jgi:hypothetical protein
MSMTNHLCWQPALVTRIIDPDAEAVRDEVFLAVHSDYELQVGEDNGTPRPMTPSEFLKRFLNPDRSYMQCVVEGESGAGKSHLIQWMRLNMPMSPDIRVVCIPKAGISLRNIVKMLIDLLPEEESRKYRERIDRSGDVAISDVSRSVRLLNGIEEAIRETPKGTIENEELEGALIELLPPLLCDPNIRREHFVRPDGIIGELVNHIFAEQRQHLATEHRREFRVSDLPTDARAFSGSADLAKATIAYLNFDAAAAPAAVDLLNRRLDDAIARTLSFTADGLIDLVNDLRRHFHRLGQRLVLLIEDFARLQGIDNALLQALITPPHQGGEQLCELRWAMAVTKGYYKSLKDTVQTRQTLMVYVDGIRPDSGGVQQGRLAKFAARYLNAVRLGPERLAEWHREAGRTTGFDEGPPNACHVCCSASIRSACHTAFGTCDDFGLYPFTARALVNMGRRSGAFTNQVFNPRQIMKAVLTKTLFTYGPDIAAAAFPPLALLEEMDSTKNTLTASLLTRLQQADRPTYDRRRALLELWQGDGSLTNLDPGIHAAFSLPSVSSFPDSGSQVPPETPVARPPQEDARIVEIEEWGRGAVPSSPLVNDIRRLLFRVVSRAIPWDELGLQKAAFSGQARSLPLSQVSFNMARQVTGEYASAVKITLPLKSDDEADLRRTVMALQGLHRFQRNQHWDFEGGQMALATFLECLDDWVAEISRQLRLLPRIGQDWNPSTAALELLAVGTLLSGGMAPSSVKTDTLLNAALTDWASTNTLHSPELQALYGRIAREREKLRHVVFATSSAPKGGQVGRMLDARLPVTTLRSLSRNGWQLSQTPPDDAGPRMFADVARLYQSVKKELQQALASEHAKRMEWLERILVHVPMEVSGTQLKSELQSAIRTASEAGLPIGSAESLNDALTRFQPKNFMDLLRATDDLRASDKPPSASLPAYGFARRDVADPCSALVRAADQLLSKAEAGLAQARLELGSQGADALEMSQERIGNALEELNALLSDIAAVDGGRAC